MYLARVVGTVVAPVQHPFYAGKKLLKVRPTDPSGRELGKDIKLPYDHVAVDRVHAGVGDLVLVLSEGSSARDLFEEPNAPVRSVVIGVVDLVEIHGKKVTESGGVSL